MTEQSEKLLIEATVKVNSEKAIEQSKKLIDLLKTANSLADELAAALSNLKFDVKI